MSNFNFRICFGLQYSGFEFHCPRISRITQSDSSLPQPCLTPHALFDEMNRSPQSSPHEIRLFDRFGFCDSPLCRSGPTNPPANSRQELYCKTALRRLEAYARLKSTATIPNYNFFGLQSFSLLCPRSPVGAADHSLSDSNSVSGGFFRRPHLEAMTDLFIVCPERFLPSGIILIPSALSVLSRIPMALKGISVNDLTNLSSHQFSTLSHKQRGDAHYAARTNFVQSRQHPI